MTRTTSAYLQRPVPDEDGDFYLFGVGNNWTRTSWRKDVNGNTLVGVLLEPAVVQLAKYTDNFNAWSKNRIGFPALDAIAPDGSPTAEIFREDGTPDQTHFVATQPPVSLTGNTTYTLSTFAAPILRDWVVLSAYTVEAGRKRAYFNVANGTLGSSDLGVSGIEPHPFIEGYYRVWVNWTTPATVTNPNIYILIADDDGGEFFSGLTQNSLTCTMPQLEEGPYPSSQIQNTSGSTATRTADSDLEWGLGTALSEGQGSLTFKILAPIHTPSDIIDLLHLTEDVSNYLKVQIDTNGYLVVSTAKTGGNSGSVTVEQNICDGQIWQIQVRFFENDLDASVINVNTSTSYSSTGADTVCDIPTGLATLEIKPSGFVLGELKIFTPPTLQSQSPAPGSTDNPGDGSIYFEIIGATTSSVEIEVNSAIVWTGDAAATGWSGSRVAVSGGYGYTLTPDESLPTGTTAVQLYAEDEGSGTLDTSYSFGSVFVATVPSVKQHASRTDFSQERDILTSKPKIEYEEPDVDIYSDDPLDEQISTLEDSRKAVDDLVNSYKAVEQLADLTQQRIDQRVGNYTIKLDPKVDAHVIEAIKRSFPEAKDPTKISYEMYKQCLARVNVPELPKVTTKDLLAAKQNPLKTDFSGYGAPSGTNRPEISSPAKLVEPIDMNEFQQSAVEKLFKLLQSFNIPYIEWRFKRHLMKHKHQS